LGDGNRLCTVSPIPACAPAPGKMSLWSTSGTIVRETMFQSSPKENGITGWIFRTDGVPSSAGKLPSRG
jgi:hypothetical protein